MSKQQRRSKNSSNAADSEPNLTFVETTYTAQNAHFSLVMKNEKITLKHLYTKLLSFFNDGIKNHERFLIISKF